MTGVYNSDAHIAFWNKKKHHTVLINNNSAKMKGEKQECCCHIPGATENMCFKPSRTLPHASFQCDIYGSTTTLCWTDRERERMKRV